MNKTKEYLKLGVTIVALTLGLINLSGTINRISLINSDYYIKRHPIIDKTKATNYNDSIGDLFLDDYMDDGTGNVVSANKYDSDVRKTSIIYDNGFKFESIIIGENNLNYSYVVNCFGELDNKNNLFTFEDGYISLSNETEAGLYSDGKYYKAVRDDELKTEIVTNDKNKTIEISETGQKSSMKRMYLFDHRIADEWTKNAIVTKDAIQLSNGADNIYIYPTENELYLSDNLIPANVIIYDTGKTSEGYNVYMMLDQLHMFEVLAENTDDIQTAFKEGSR